MLARAAATGLLNKRIFFPLPVDESELVDAAARFHVGLIPYEPHGANHQHCCPNKMSQYMAAGLPMLANETSYVGEVIRRADAGLVVDFRDRQALARAVNLLASDPVARERFARNSADHSCQHSIGRPLAWTFIRTWAACWLTGRAGRCNGSGQGVAWRMT